MNLAQYIERRVEQFPTKMAMRCGDTRLTYEEFWTLVNRFGNGLRSLGLKKTDRVAIMLPNCPELLVIHWATLKIGCTFSPVNTMFKDKELSYILKNSGAKVTVTSTEFLPFFENVWNDCPALEHLVLTDATVAGTINFQALVDASASDLGIVDCDPNQTADLYYTSGTTGRPKGVMKTHFSLSKLQEYQQQLYDTRSTDHSIVVLPLFHSYAMVIPSMTMLYVGASQTIMERWDTKTILDTIQNDKITFFAAVPTMYTYLVRYPEFEKYDLTSLRHAMCGGASNPVEIQRTFEERTRVMITELYGCTGWVATMTPPTGIRKHGSIGKPWNEICPHMDTAVKIIDENGKECAPGQHGEVIARGAQLPPGFWHMPDKTREVYRDGWCYTGDICYKDEDGFLFFVDRMDDLIITAGYNVYPREVEEVLYTHPKINECAVIGYPDDEKGEIVAAYISLKPGENSTAEEMSTYCKERIANYKAPKIVEFIAEIPKTANGKIYKKGLRDQMPGRAKSS